MDFCQGGELFKHILDRGFFDEVTNEYRSQNQDSARFYIAEVILAIESLHKAGIIHRDIKPENILISSTGHVVVCDLGVCYDRMQNVPCSSPEASPDPDNDMYDNRVCGTYDYMAPEVIAQSAPYGKAVDWWSVGCLLYEMTSGNPPFVCNSRKKMLDMIMRSKLKLPPFLSKDLHSLLRGLLERDVSKRLGAEKATFTQIGGVAKLKQHPFFKVPNTNMGDIQKIDWYALERGEIEPPLHLQFDSDIDTKYFLQMYTQFPLDQLQHLYSNIRGHPVKHFTFIGEEFKEFECCQENRI